MKFLILDNNMIESLNNFPAIPSLQTLSLANNNIKDLMSFLNSVKAKFPRLTSLNTFRNPMNPGMMNPSNYNQYKNYVRQLGHVQELDGMNINDNSFMNQGQQSQPKRDLFGTSSNVNPSPTPNKVNFFADNNTQNNAATQNNQNKMFASTNPTMTAPTQQKPKIGMFDNIPLKPSKTVTQSVMMFGNERNNNDFDMNLNNGQVLKRQIFVIDESAELDGTDFVKSKKKKSLIKIDEKIFKKSDNMTKFNRKNRSEGNKHILNQDL